MGRFSQPHSADLPADIFASGAGAAVFLPIGDRIAAICFGHVHIALNDDAFERQFGLKVTLNTVPRGQLRTLDLATPDAVTCQKRVQASRDSDLQAFGVDMLRDLARVAGGTPTDLTFARFVAGKDSLSITCEVKADGLQQKCAEIIKTYKKVDYQREFAWVDNMRIVHEKDTIKLLDGQLEEALGKLRDGQASQLHMAPPEIVNYTEGNELHYNGFGSHGTTFHSLSIDDYVAELNRCDFDDEFSELKANHRIKAKGDGEDEFSEKWRVYDCFVFETSLGVGDKEKHYVLFAGDWYVVEKRFKKLVEDYFDALEKVEIIGATTCANERDLIADIEANRPELLKLDQQKINPSGVRYGNLEPCDFLSKNGEFIHLKDGDSSGPISHVWMQGLVSAEAFVSDAKFRKTLRAKVKSLGQGFEAQLPKSGEPVDRTKFKVVYGVMRKPYADGTLGLPFFSKVSLQAAAQRIEQFGFAIAIELIEKPAGEAAEDE
ncbi:TIGR04141 family sporadically distributed protein [Mesorhizobium sp. M6A.T.Cr.TU.016.01.1.1]|uniref:TIGR04141 family sporadically distributed protein n=1 Tax=Mesorhizobium sp. M6A.T.Cr.TU.016.01.1.1 TaxID=2493677 RepID=UPI0013E07D0E|nr:TIGR04141 family sporadically distributed protein [Mesorhizobium sp. M6A.T.Cr.TU.016.01.1.1]